MITNADARALLQIGGKIDELLAERDQLKTDLAAHKKIIGELVYGLKEAADTITTLHKMVDYGDGHSGSPGEWVEETWSLIATLISKHTTPAEPLVD